MRNRKLRTRPLLPPGSPPSSPSLRGGACGCARDLSRTQPRRQRATRRNSSLPATTCCVQKAFVALSKYAPGSFHVAKIRAVHGHSARRAQCCGDKMSIQRKQYEKFYTPYGGTMMRSGDGLRSGTRPRGCRRPANMRAADGTASESASAPQTRRRGAVLPTCGSVAPASAAAGVERQKRMPPACCKSALEQRGTQGGARSTCDGTAGAAAAADARRVRADETKIFKEL